MRAVLFCLLLMCSGLLFAQDTIYTFKKVLYNVKIRDQQADFIEYRLPDDFDKVNYFINTTDIVAVKRKGCAVEQIIHDSPTTFHSVYFFIETNGDTVKEDLAYNPAGKFAIDPSVKLCRL